MRIAIARLAFAVVLPIAAIASAQITFRERHIDISESVDSIRLHVVRNEGIGKRLALPWCTIDGTARADIDFWRARDSAIFTPGDTMCVITVGIRDNMNIDSTRVFIVVLTSTAGNDTAAITIHDNDLPASPFITADPPTIDFGTVAVGVLATRPVKVQYSGSGELMFGMGAVSPGPESGFEIANQPTILMIGPGGGVNLQLGFKPPRGSAGTERRGVITLRTNAGMCPVPVVGTVVDSTPPIIAFDAPHEHDTLAAGSTVKLAIQITDSDSLVDATVEYAAENGRGIVAHVTTDVTTVTWAIPEGLASDRVRLRVQARDRMGNVAQGQSVVFAVRPKR